jgi:hypothetical protein
MDESIRISVRQLLFFSAFVALACFILAVFLPRHLVSPALPFTIVFFILVTYSVLAFLVRANKKGFTKFINAFMITTGLKLILFILIVVGYTLLNTGDAVTFLGTFFILYLFYTGFEVYAILRLLKAGKKK